MLFQYSNFNIYKSVNTKYNILCNIRHNVYPLFGVSVYRKTITYGNLSTL